MHRTPPAAGVALVTIPVALVFAGLAAAAPVPVLRAGAGVLMAATGLLAVLAVLALAERARDADLAAFMARATVDELLSRADRDHAALVSLAAIAYASTADSRGAVNRHRAARLWLQNSAGLTPGVAERVLDLYDGRA